jgi:hypothetical protein
LGAAVAYWIVYTGSGVFSRDPAAAPDAAKEDARSRPKEFAAEAAMQYAEALRDRDCEAVIERTAWMQDRLERVRLAGGIEAEAAEREKLADRIVAWHEEKNVLAYEGVEDAYVFAPGCGLALAEPPVAGARASAADEEIEIVWLRVVYPHQHRALRGAMGRPIRALLAGVAIGRNGQVVKSAIRGNLEIARSSVEYSWPEQRE